MGVHSSAGRKLAALRSYKGLTQDKLHKELGISRTAIERMERGIGSPTIRSLIAISKYFNHDINVFLTDAPLVLHSEEMVGV